MTAQNTEASEAPRLQIVTGGLPLGTSSVITLSGGTTVAVALEAMLAQRISQVPVIDVRGNVQGLFTVAAVARALTDDVSPPKNLMSSWIEDYLEEATFVATDLTPDQLLPSLLKLSGGGGEALLYGSPTQLRGILTWEDLLAYYAEASRPFLLIEHIEVTVRALIRSRFVAVELPEAISAALADGLGRKPQALEECSFDQYRLVLTCRQHRERFRQVFGPSTGRVQQHLTAVRDIRNKVMHFRDRADEFDLDRLKKARGFLDVKLQRAQSPQREGTDQ